MPAELGLKGVETSLKTCFKTLRENSEGKVQREQYLLAVGLGCYKWYQSQSLSGVPARTLGLKGVDCEIPHRLERKTKHSL